MGTIFSNTISPGLGHGLEEFQMELETQSGRSGPAGTGAERPICSTKVFRRRLRWAFVASISKEELVIRPSAPASRGRIPRALHQ
jgi:hypothetical protein